MVTVFGGSTTTYTLTDLKKFSTYQLFLVPFFKSIEGRPSNLLSVRTYEDVPSAPPMAINVKAINASCALLEWTAPPEDSQNGQIRGYRVQIYENNTVLYANLTLDASFNSVVLYNLSFTSYYSIRALAYTAVGNGPYSQPIYLNMEAALRNSYEDIHLQPSNYQNLYPFRQVWFYVFVALILAILILIIVKIVFIYVHRKATKSTYEKANSLNENYSDNFPKYDSGSSSKYSSYPDNNEYAEVNDLKNYSKNHEKSILVPYAMTPLIEKSTSSNSSRASYNHSGREVPFIPPENDMTTESLLTKPGYKNAGLMNRSTNYMSQCNQGLYKNEHDSISSKIKLNSLPQRPVGQMCNEYETANEEAISDRHNSAIECEDNLGVSDQVVECNSVTNFLFYL